MLSWGGTPNCKARRGSVSDPFPSDEGPGGFTGSISKERVPFFDASCVDARLDSGLADGFYEPIHSFLSTRQPPMHDDENGKGRVFPLD